MARMELLNQIEQTRTSASAVSLETEVHSHRDSRFHDLDPHLQIDVNISPDVDVLKLVRSSLEQLEETVARWSFLSNEIKSLVKSKPF